MPGRFALLIGNSTFDDPALERLAAPENDVIALKEVLERSEIAGFETRLLLNAGMDEARGAVFDLFADRTPDDLVLFYYTGHGLRDAHGDLYLALPQTSARAPGKIALEADFVRRQMAKSYSRRQVLILDCCHSGAFMPGAKGVEAGLSRDDFLPAGGHGRYILAAAAANQSAFEAEGRSIFTRHLVDALRNGEAAPERETVTIEDLHAYVCRRVASDQAPMQPRIWVDEQTEPLIIARNPQPRKPLPQTLVDMLWGADVDRAHSAAIRLVGIARGGDRQLAADAERVLRQRLDKPDDLPLLVASPILEALGPRGPGQAEEVRALEAGLAAEREARTRLEAELAARAAELAAERARAAQLAARAEGTTAGTGTVAPVRQVTDVIMPVLGENTTEAILLRWLKQVGDTVDEGEPIYEVETDKAVLEMTAGAGGTLGETYVAGGATVRAGDRVGLIVREPADASRAGSGPIGRAEIGRVFDVAAVGKVAGCLVTEGCARLGARVRLLRRKGAAREGWIRSLQVSRQDVREVPAGEECGMTFGDIEAFRVGEVVEILGE